MDMPLQNAGASADNDSQFERYNSAKLYDAIAPNYDAGYEAATYQRAYDKLAWTRAIDLLPARSCTVIDAGCGTGRWAEWLTLAGHRVIGIEQSAEMVRQIENRNLGDTFTLLQERMENVDLSRTGADAVFAMGSLQFTNDPAAQLKRFVSWLRPGGHIAIYVDSLVALVLELLRIGKTEEALLRLHTHMGEWQTHGQSANVHLYDERRLRADFAAAGLISIQAYGLLSSASAHGSSVCTKHMQEDEAAFLECERQLSMSPLLVDVGKHILMLGQKPE